jgi:hypothetical protein
MQSLIEKRAENPQAYDFGSFGEGQSVPAAEAGNRFDEAFRSVAALSGVEIWLKNNLYCRPPMLREERQMLRAQSKFAEEDAESGLDIAVEAVLGMLFVREGNALRPAEESDIERQLNSGDLMAILSGAMGVSLSETDAGNA